MKFIIVAQNVVDYVQYFQIEIAHRLVSREMQSLVMAFQAVDRSYYGDSYNEDYRR